MGKRFVYPEQAPCSLSYAEREAAAARAVDDVEHEVAARLAGYALVTEGPDYDTRRIQGRIRYYRGLSQLTLEERQDFVRKIERHCDRYSQR